MGGDDQATLARGFDGVGLPPAQVGASADAFSRQDRILVMSAQIQAAQTAAARDLMITAYQSLANAPAPPLEIAR